MTKKLLLTIFILSITSLVFAIDYTSQYPTQDTDHVKASGTVYGGAQPYYATDPTKSLTGSYTNGWMIDGVGCNATQRFHIDLGSAKIVTRIYLENGHNSGGWTDMGVKNFTFWGSNTAGSFAELTYATDTGWTQLTTSINHWEQHSGSDAVDPQYTTVTNTTAYQYYAFKFADNWTSASSMGVRRIELQTEDTVTRRVMFIN
jgi:hypothetical protein